MTKIMTKPTDYWLFYRVRDELGRFARHELSKRLSVRLESAAGNCARLFAASGICSCVALLAGCDPERAACPRGHLACADGHHPVSNLCRRLFAAGRPVVVVAFAPESGRSLGICVGTRRDCFARQLYCICHGGLTNRRLVRRLVRHSAFDEGGSNVRVAPIPERGCLSRSNARIPRGIRFFEPLAEQSGRLRKEFGSVE
jgi:hypothetical protein